MGRSDLSDLFKCRCLTEGPRYGDLGVNKIDGHFEGIFRRI